MNRKRNQRTTSSKCTGVVLGEKYQIIVATVRKAQPTQKVTGIRRNIDTMGVELNSMRAMDVVRTA
jgi:hypothetical protein